jgi:hypothetical protein
LRGGGISVIVDSVTVDAVIVDAVIVVMDVETHERYYRYGALFDDLVGEYVEVHERWFHSWCCWRCG